ncbi:hypothetical protein FJT64_013996 [Amphibalanus amphitrite]|uniref:Apple domain-containing protein n=1 Tax=Amphibalanus amphitrite TaxID=1232801 RepID=A0A6A4V3C4_AMPAM|nr:hypothetical protein FJT64_013996 [Amphibalanus amphitrite]
MQRFCWSLAALLAAVGLSAAVQFGLVTGRHPSSPLLEVPGSSRVLCAIRCLRDTSCVSWEVTGSGCSLYRGVTSDPTAATSSRPLWADLWIPDGYQMFGLVTGRHPSSPLLEVPGSSRVLCAIRCLRDTSCVSWEVTGSGCSLYRGVTSDQTAATSSGPLWADLWIPDGYQMFGLVTGRHPSSPLLEVPGSSRVLCAIRCLGDTSCVSWEVTGSGCSLYRGVTSDPTAATSSGPLWADLWIPDGYQMFGLVTGRHPSSPLLEVPGSSRVLCAIRCLRDTSCVSWEVTGSGCSLYRGVTSDPTAATSSGPLWADL